jgi:hypothetical protein
VFVGCKLPTGLLMEIIPEATVFNPPPAGTRIQIKGANSLKNDYSLRGLAQPMYPYAITEVPGEVFKEWMKRNAQSLMVRNGFVFAADRRSDAVSEGKERESERMGLEPLNPKIELDPRVRAGRAEQRVTADPDRLAELNRKNSWEVE